MFKMLDIFFLISSILGVILGVLHSIDIDRCIIFSFKYFKASLKYISLLVIPFLHNSSEGIPNIFLQVIPDIALVIECKTTSASLFPINPREFSKIIPPRINFLSLF